MMGVPGDGTQLSKNDGVVAYSTIIAISESPVLPGVVWAGTDDGNLQVSRTAAQLHRSRKEHAGPAAEQPVLDLAHRRVAFRRRRRRTSSVDGHRSDDLKPYVFVTHDYGQTLESIASNLPAFGNVQVVREDPKNRNLLYVGTEFGLFVSLDGGKTWQKFMNNYPTVRTDDILDPPARRRSDRRDARPQHLDRRRHHAAAAADAGGAGAGRVLFDVRPAVAYLNDRQHGQQVGGQKVFVGENAPRGAAINYYLKAAASGDVKITIADATGKVIRTLDGTKRPASTA